MTVTFAKRYRHIFTGFEYDFVGFRTLYTSGPQPVVLTRKGYEIVVEQDQLRRLYEPIEEKKA